MFYSVKTEILRKIIFNFLIYNFYCMKNIKKYIAWGIISMISISGIVYAAQNIERFDQTVSMNDVITAAWYNLVNGTLDGPNTDGWICSWTASGGIMCAGTGGWWWVDVPLSDTTDFDQNCQYRVTNQGSIWNIQAVGFIDAPSYPHLSVLRLQLWNTIYAVWAPMKANIRYSNAINSPLVWGLNPTGTQKLEKNCWNSWTPSISPWGTNLPSNVEIFNVPFAELIKFHNNCSVSSDLSHCISAANRYCQDACVKNPSWINCAGGVSGKNFTTWFISEINAAGAAVSCVWGIIIGGGTVIQKSIYKQSIDNNPDTSVPEWNALIDLAIEHVPVLAIGWGTWWAESCYITQNTLFKKPDWTQVPNKTPDWVYLPWARWETVIQRCADIICSAAYQHPQPLAQGVHCWNNGDSWGVWCPNWNYTIKCMY